MVVLCNYNISLGWVDIAVEFDLMSVNQSLCNSNPSIWGKEAKPILGYPSRGNLAFVRNAIKPDGGVV